MKISQGIVLKDNWLCRYSLVNLKTKVHLKHAYTLLQQKNNKVWTIKNHEFIFFCRELKGSKWVQ